MKRLKQMMRGVRYRGSLLYHYLFDREARRRTNLKEMRYHLFSPSMYRVAMQAAEMVREDEQYKHYLIRGYRDIFLYPASAPYYSLAMVLSEARPAHWHYYEIPQTRVVPGDVVVDCGSAEGFFVFRNLHVAGKIYALEPMPLFIESLQTLFRHRESVIVLPFAAGDTCRKACIRTDSTDTIIDAAVQEAADAEGLEIDVVTLDSLFADKGIKVNYIKADIEGFEEKMIAGALKTIRMSKPKIAVTTYHKGQDYKKLIRMIRAVVPEYQYLVKGIDYLSGNPVMLHMWV